MSIAEHLRDESGTTLVELMVALMTGLIIISALSMAISPDARLIPCV